MNREILFRGKKVDNNEWAYGSLVNNAFFKLDTKISIPYIFNPEHCDSADCFEDFTEDFGYYEVIPETIGQYTNIDDKNKTKVFEGDIATCYILFPSIFHDDGETTEARIVECDFEVVYACGEYILKPFDEKHPTLTMWEFMNEEVDEQYFLDILSVSNDFMYKAGEEERDYLNSLLNDKNITLEQLIKGSSLTITGNIHENQDV